MTHFPKALCLKAHKLAPGKTGPELAAALGVKYAKDAHALSALGYRYEQMDGPKLSDGELALILALAAQHRRLLEQGETRSPELKYVSYACRKSRGWAFSTASKRLDRYRAGEDRYRPGGTGLGLVDLSHNGYANLTPAGWALVHAIEVEKAKAAARAVAVGVPEIDS